MIVWKTLVEVAREREREVSFTVYASKYLIGCFADQTIPQYDRVIGLCCWINYPRHDQGSSEAS